MKKIRYREKKNESEEKGWLCTVRTESSGPGVTGLQVKSMSCGSEVVP